MLTIDHLTAGVGVLSFIIFLFNHWITFRWVSPEHLLRSLLICVITTMTFPIVLMGVAFGFKVVDAPISGWLCALFLAILIQGLLCFFYVLCIFGPYETSVRMRLIREIAQGGTQGITRQDLLGQYNAATIVKIRLQRLTGSGDLVEKDGRYRIVRAQNLFFIFDAVAGVIKKWIGR